MVDRTVVRVGVFAALAMAGFATQFDSASAAGRTPLDRECLARAMYFESDKSSEDGMLAVGTVVANRLKSGRYGGSVCGVVGQRGQFAAGVMSRRMDGAAAERARRVAQAVMDGHRHPSVKTAMFFHTAGYRFGYGNMHYLTVAGGNIFYEKRSAKTPAAARANALSMARAYGAAKADKAAVAPVLMAAMRGQRPVRSAPDVPIVFAQIVPLPASSSSPAPIPTPRPSQQIRFGSAPLSADGFVLASAYREPGDETSAAGSALAAVAALAPKARPGKPVRTVAPAAPVQAAATPVLVADAHAPRRSPMANALIAAAWASYR